MHRYILKSYQVSYIAQHSFKCQRKELTKMVNMFLVHMNSTICCYWSICLNVVKSASLPPTFKTLLLTLKLLSLTPVAFFKKSKEDLIIVKLTY